MPIERLDDPDVGRDDDRGDWLADSHSARIEPARQHLTDEESCDLVPAREVVHQVRGVVREPARESCSGTHNHEARTFGARGLQDGHGRLGYLVGRAAPGSPIDVGMPARAAQRSRMPVGRPEPGQLGGRPDESRDHSFVFVASVAAAWLGTALAVTIARRRPLVRASTAAWAVAVVVAFAFVTLWPSRRSSPSGSRRMLTLEPIDRPGYEWLVAEAAVTGTAHDVIDFLTQAGDPTPMALVGAVTMLAFTFGWGRRDRIIVPLLVGGTFLSAWVLQRVTEYLVGRDSPPLGAGTFPSGGSARILCVTVLVVILAAMRWQWPVNAAAHRLVRRSDARRIGGVHAVGPPHPLADRRDRRMGGRGGDRVRCDPRRGAVGAPITGRVAAEVARLLKTRGIGRTARLR